MSDGRRCVAKSRVGGIKDEWPMADAEMFPHETIRDVSRSGVDKATVFDVLTHRAGVFVPGFVSRPQDWGDWDQVRAALIAARPCRPRGVLAYMPYEFGWILAEVARRASGCGLGEFVREEIADVAGIPGLRFSAVREELQHLSQPQALSATPATSPLFMRSSLARV